MSAKIAPSQIRQNQATQKAAFKSPNGPAPEGPGELVTVKAGDTLSELAQAKLGDAALWTEIAANNPQIGNPDKIWPGDQIRMPLVADNKLNEAEVADKTGAAENTEQVENFSQKNDQAQVVAKKQTGQLNFLMNKLETEQKKVTQNPASSKPATTDEASNKPGSQPLKESPSAAAAGRDFSVDQAISQIKKQPPPLSAQGMREAIVDGVGDRDDKGASTEFKQLSRFVKKNWSRFGPGAQQVWGMYEKTAKKAQQKGLTGIPDKQWDKMVGRMDKICTKEAQSNGVEDSKIKQNQDFNWGDVPVDARSPELQQVLTQLRALAQQNIQQNAGAVSTPGAAGRPISQDPQTQQMMEQQAQSGLPPFPDADTAKLAQGMGMKPPLSFEDMLFLLQMKYATNKEKELLQKMNELSRGGGAQQGAATGQAGAQAPTQGAGQGAGQAQVPPQTSAEDRAYMQQAAQQAQAQQQGGNGAAQAGSQNKIPQQSQEVTNMIMQRIGGAVEQFESPNSEGGEMITLNEMNKLVSLAKKLPPEQQNMLKAQAYQAAVTEGGLTTEAFSALMGYVNSKSGAAQANPSSAAASQVPGQAQGTAQQTGPAATSATSSQPQSPAYDPNADAIDLHKAMRGFGTDEKAIYQILQNRSAAERKALRTAYKKLYGHNLINELRSELSFGEEDLALKLLLRND